MSLTEEVDNILEVLKMAKKHERPLQSISTLLTSTQHFVACSYACFFFFSEPSIIKETINKHFSFFLSRLPFMLLIL